MPTPAQFFLHCPSETVATGATNTAYFGTVVYNGGPVQTKLDEYLSIDGRAAESAGLNLGSYLADPTSQPLYELSDDMDASYDAIGSSPPPGLGGFFDLHAYVSLGAPVDGARTATPGTASLLRHFVTGSEVLVQLEGDAVFQRRMLVSDVTEASMSLYDDDGELPQDATVFVTAVLMSDKERAKTVIAFRQFQRFASPSVAADEESFNPGLYLLLYKAIDPDVLGMTAAQLYDDYSGRPGRVGSVADLRRAFDSPEASSLVISELLDIAPGAALKLDGVMVRSIATRAEVLADDLESMSDTALVSAAAARQLVQDSVRGLQQFVESESLTVSHQLSLPGALSLDLTTMRVAVPLDAFTVDAVEVRGDKVVARTMTTDNLTSEIASLGEATATTLDAKTVVAADMSATHFDAVALTAVTGVFEGDLTAGNTALGDLQARSASLGPTKTADLRTEGAANVDGSLASGPLTVAGDAVVSGGVVASDVETTGGVSAGSGAFVADGTAVAVRVPMTATELTVTGKVATAALTASRVEADDVEATRAKLDALESNTIDADALTVGSVQGGLRVFGKTFVEELECTDLRCDRVDADDARFRNMSVTQFADVLTLVSRKDVVAARTVSGSRLVASQLDVTGQAAFETLVSSDTATLNELEVERGATVAGDVTIAGTLDAGATRVRGSMDLKGDLAVQRVVVDRDLFVEYGNVKVTRGSVDVHNDVAIGGRMTLGADLVAGGQGVFGPGGVRTAGDVVSAGDVFGANALFSGYFKAGAAALGDLTAGAFRCEGIDADGSIRAGGDISTAGALKIEGPVIAKGAITAMEIQVFGDIEAGQDARVARDLEIGGRAEIDGDLLVSGDAGVVGVLACESLKVGVGVEAASVAVSGQVSAEGDLSAGGDLKVTGDASFGGDVEALGDFAAQALAIRSDAVFSASVSVSADCEVQGDLSCDGDLRLDGSMTVSGAVRMEGDLECGDLVARDARLNDVVAADVRAHSLSAPALGVGCLTADARAVEVSGPVSCVGMVVRGATSLTGPISLDGVVDFGTAPVSLRSPLTAPTIGSEVAAIRVGRFNKIGFTPASELLAYPSGSDPSGVQTRIDALQTQLDAMSLQLAALTANLIVWVTASALPDAVAGAPYSQQLKAQGAADHFVVVAGALPVGMSVDLAGLLSGTATSGTYSFTVRVRSAANSLVDADRAFLLRVVSGA
jgi:predicted acyltransferase (DUF342 family)